MIRTDSVGSDSGRPAAGVRNGVDVDLDGTVLGGDDFVGANPTVMLELTVSEEAFDTGPTTVARELPSGRVAVGVPTEHRPFPEELAGGNRT